MWTEQWSQTLSQCIDEKLKPYVRKIDEDAYYPLEYMKAFGEIGLLRSEGLSDEELRFQGVRLVEETAQVCMTTAFNIWCHLAATAYVRYGDSAYLRNEI